MKEISGEVLARLEKAQKLFLEKKYQQSLEEYSWVEKQFQDDPETLSMIRLEMGWTHYAAGNYKQAVRYLKEGIKSSELKEHPKEYFDSLQMLSFSCEATGDTTNAVDYFKKALQLSVDEKLKKPLFFEVGKILFVQQNYSEAKSYLEKVIELPESPAEKMYRETAIYYLGFIALFEKDYRTAIRFFNRYIEEASGKKERAPGYFGLAHVYRARKEYPALIDVCKKIIHLDTDFFDKETLGYFICLGYMELQMWDELDTFLPELMRNYPEGRYKNTYPIFEQALRERKRPGEEPGREESGSSESNQ